MLYMQRAVVTLVNLLPGFAEAGALSHQLGTVKGALTTLALYAKHCKGATEEQVGAIAVHDTWVHVPSPDKRPLCRCDMQRPEKANTECPNHRVALQAAALKKILDLDSREAVLQVYQHMLSKPPSQQQQQQAAAAAGQGTLEEQLSSLSLTGQCAQLMC
jgi:hypothetical protein